jgi:uncharacterized protein (TIGR02147 family)
MRAGIEYGLEKPSAADPRGLSVFHFINYRKFLQAYYDFKKQRYYGFSYRSFNQSIGVRSPGLLLDLINARQNLTEKLHRKFAETMKMDRQESEYFWLMVMLTHAKEKGDLKVKQDFQTRMSMLKPADAKSLIPCQEKYLSSWHNIAVRESLGILDVADEVSELARFLNPEITVDQARESLELLESLGLIRKNDQGFWKPETRSVTAMGSDISPAVVHQSQKDILELGKRALDVYPRGERHVSSVIFSVSGEAEEKIKAAVEGFRRQVFEIIKSDGRPERTLALSLALFPIGFAKAEAKLEP